MGQTFKLSSFLFLTVLLVAFSCGPGAKAEKNLSSSQNPEGELVFKKQCALCHGMSGNKQLSGAKKLTASVLELEEIKNLVANGLRQMPAFKGRLTEEEIQLVSAYAFQFRNSK